MISLKKASSHSFCPVFSPDQLKFKPIPGRVQPQSDIMAVPFSIEVERCLKESVTLEQAGLNIMQMVIMISQQGSSSPIRTALNAEQQTRQRSSRNFNPDFVVDGAGKRDDSTLALLKITEEGLDLFFATKSKGAPEDNQDAFKKSIDLKFCAMTDGVGSSGKYAKEWAMLLTRCFVEGYEKMKGDDEIINSPYTIQVMHQLFKKGLGEVLQSPELMGLADKIAREGVRIPSSTLTLTFYNPQLRKLFVFQLGDTSVQVSEARYRGGQYMEATHRKSVVTSSKNDDEWQDIPGQIGLETFVSFSGSEPRLRSHEETKASFFNIQKSRLSGLPNTSNHANDVYAVVLQEFQLTSLPAMMLLATDSVTDNQPLDFSYVRNSPTSPPDESWVDSTARLARQPLPPLPPLFPLTASSFRPVKSSGPLEDRQTKKIKLDDAYLNGLEPISDDEEEPQNFLLPQAVKVQIQESQPEPEVKPMQEVSSTEPPHQDLESVYKALGKGAHSEILALHGRDDFDKKFKQCSLVVVRFSGNDVASIRRIPLTGKDGLYEELRVDIFKHFLTLGHVDTLHHGLVMAVKDMHALTEDEYAGWVNHHNDSVQLFVVKNAYCDKHGISV